jgi:DNA-binding LacI/PurR family transcriptional regulator
VRVSEATRARVLAVARRLHYTPNRIAQQLKGVRSQVLGVIVDTVNLPVMSDRLAALEARARRSGYRLMIGQTHGDPAGVRSYLDDFEARAVDGVLCLFDPRADRPKALRPIFRDRHVVFHARAVQRDGLCVRVDTEDAMAQLTGHLLDRGRRRVGLALESPVDEMMELRRRGWERAHEARGLTADPALVWSLAGPLGPPDAQVLDAIIDQLVVRGGADAIAASDDVWGVRLIQRLKARGLRVPADVAVTGYDNLDVGTIVDPALTTIDQQHDAYADAAIELLLASAAGEPVAEPTRTIKGKLIVRASS